MLTIWSAIPTVDRVFNGALSLGEAPKAPLGAMPSTPRSGGDAMPTFPIAADVHEKADEYTFHVDLPGVKLEDLEVTLESQVLAIRGERRFERGPQEKVTCGRPHGPFAVSYALPQGIDGERLTADLADGVLTVRVPKRPQAQPRKIPISGGADRTPLAG